MEAQQYIGIDLHKAFFQACAVTQTGHRLWEDRFPRSDVGIAALLTRCSRQTAIAVEATTPTWSFVDRLVPTGAAVTIVDTRKTKLKAGYAAKTDRLDARRLADALRRESVVSIYYPPPGIRDLRELCRHRQMVSQMRVRVVQRIRALLLRQGLPDPPIRSLMRPRGLTWLSQTAVSGRAGDTLHMLSTLLSALTEQLGRVEVDVHDEAARDRIVDRLQTLRGIGPVLGLTIRAEIGCIRRFATSAHLASYAGLVPRVEQSGTVRRHGRITKEGSPWLRWALVEAGMHGLRRCDQIGRWARGLAMRKGARTAHVALARQLCEDIFQVWRQAM